MMCDCLTVKVSSPSMPSSSARSSTSVPVDTGSEPELTLSIDASSIFFAPSGSIGLPAHDHDHARSAPKAEQEQGEGRKQDERPQAARAVTPNAD